MKRLRIILGAILATVLLSGLVAAPAQASPAGDNLFTSHLGGKNSGKSYTAAIVHRYNDGKIYGPRLTLERGKSGYNRHKSKRLVSSVGCAVYVPPRSKVMVYRQGVFITSKKSKTNRTARGYDWKFKSFDCTNLGTAFYPWRFLITRV